MGRPLRPRAQGARSPRACRKRSFPGRSTGDQAPRARLAGRQGSPGPADREQGPGSVAASGWQTMVQPVHETIYVDWLCSAAAVWRRDVFDDYLFDERFEGYSYLEDLDFSYSVSRKFRLAIVGGPGFLHFPSPRGRISGFHFGKVEAANRLYFVRKHGLSTVRCYAGILIRLAMTLGQGMKERDPYFVQRACGNVAGLVDSRIHPFCCISPGAGRTSPDSF